MTVSTKTQATQALVLNAMRPYSGWSSAREVARLVGGRPPVMSTQQAAAALALLKAKGLVTSDTFSTRRNAFGEKSGRLTKWSLTDLGRATETV